MRNNTYTFKGVTVFKSSLSKNPQFLNCRLLYIKKLVTYFLFQEARTRTQLQLNGCNQKTSGVNHAAVQCPTSGIHSQTSLPFQRAYAAPLLWLCCLKPHNLSPRLRSGLLRATPTTILGGHLIVPSCPGLGSPQASHSL